MSKFLFFLQLVIIFSLIFVCTACGGTIASADGMMKCSRAGSIDGGTTNMNYEVYYEGEYLTILHSVEQIISDDSSILDIYEEAYNNINKQYKGLEYYDTEVVRDNNSVTRDTTINYAKIDIEALLDIEGSEDNVIDSDGKVKLQTWLDFTKPFGVKCE